MKAVEAIEEYPLKADSDRCGSSKLNATEWSMLETSGRVSTAKIEARISLSSLQWDEWTSLLQLGTGSC